MQNKKYAVSINDIIAISEKYKGTFRQATDEQKDKIINRIGTTQDNINFCNALKFDAAKEIIDLFDRQDFNGIYYECLACHKRFSKPITDSGCLGWLFGFLFLICFIGMFFTFGATILGCIIWGVCLYLVSTKKCPYCKSKSMVKYG